MASTKFEVSMEIFKFQGEPDVSVTLTGKSPTELETALKTLETIAKTTTLYDGNSAPEAEKNVPNEPQQAAPVVSSADKKAPPPEKPVSWLTPVGAKGLMLLRCPKCKSEFVQFLREPQTTIDPETLRPTAHIIRGYVPETKDGVFCDGCNHCLGWEYGAHVIGYFKYCPYCGNRLEDGTEEEK